MRCSRTTRCTKPPTEESAAALASFDADWCTLSVAGRPEDEPTAVAIAIRRGAAVAAARMLHGIDGDPDQFTAAVEPAEDNAHRQVTIQAWMTSCALAQLPPSVSLSRCDTFRDGDAAILEHPSPPSSNGTPCLSAAQSPFISIAFSTPGSSAGATPAPALTIGSTCYMPGSLGGRDSRPLRLSRLNLLRHESVTSGLRAGSAGLPALTDRASPVRSP
jgi:hypothetical protein